MASVHTVLEVVVDERLDVLARRLAAVYALPPADPMAPEWVVVPSTALNRWLRLELSTCLGSSGPGRTDGVAANIVRLSPQGFRQRLLFPHDDKRDPWHVAHLVWVVLQTLVEAQDDAQLAGITRLPEGSTLWARANRIATIFDRYITHRPAMVREWTSGRDVVDEDEPVPVRLAWQPVLWRGVRSRIGRPSPAERLPVLTDDLRAGRCAQDVPERIVLFALRDLSGGAVFLDLLEALAATRDVYLYLQQPSMGYARDPRGKSDHPLLRSWARESRETLTLIQGWSPGSKTTEAFPRTLLQKLQADIRANRAPSADWELADSDRSVRIHRCHGSSRQVEVLRDELLHLLSDAGVQDLGDAGLGDADLGHPIREDDIVVMCPDLEKFRPLIEAKWGPSAGDQSGAPSLSYHITESSLGSQVPLVNALGAVVELAASGISAVAILDLVALAPVRERYGFTDADIDTLADWMESANTRWGIDGEHRSRWGLPADFEDSSLMMLVDRLLIGVATSDDPLALGVGDLLPIGVEGDGISLAGRFSDLMFRLKRFVSETCMERPVEGWVDLLQGLSAELFATAFDDRWQETNLAGLFASILRDAGVGHEASPVAITFADLRMVVGRQIQAAGGRGVFFRGGITVCPPAPLSGIPHRVVALLGMDETAFAASPPDGDDLLCFAPAIGDPDHRSRTRQALLDALLSAESNLVVTCSGHSIVTNKDVPPAVMLSEFQEVITSTIAPASLDESFDRIRIDHPRQAYDLRNFIAGEIDPAVQAPWSFDPVALEGTRREGRKVLDDVFLNQPITIETPTVFELAELGRFLKAPVKTFLRRSLGVDVAEAPDRRTGKTMAPVVGPSGMIPAAPGHNLVAALDHLEKWNLQTRLLTHRRQGLSLDSFRRRERASQRLAPGALFDQQLCEAQEVVQAFVDALDENAVGARGSVDHPIDIVLQGGLRVVGSVTDDGGRDPGPIRTITSKDARFRLLVGWVDLLALSVAEPSRRWCATHIAKARNGNKVVTTKLWVRGSDAAAREAVARGTLSLIVDLFLRGLLEPLPLFERVSALLSEPKDARVEWDGYPAGTGERADAWIRTWLGDLSYDDLLAIPVEARDPDGPGAKRVERFAHHLWGAFDHSVTQTRPDEGD